MKSIIQAAVPVAKTRAIDRGWCPEHIKKRMGENGRAHDYVAGRGQGEGRGTASKGGGTASKGGRDGERRADERDLSSDAGGGCFVAQQTVSRHPSLFWALIHYITRPGPAILKIPHREKGHRYSKIYGRTCLLSHPGKLARRAGVFPAG